VRRLRAIRLYWLYGVYAIPVWLFVFFAVVFLPLAVIRIKFHVSTPNPPYFFSFSDPNRTKLLATILTNVSPLVGYLAWFYIIRGVVSSGKELNDMALNTSGKESIIGMRRLAVEKKLPLARFIRKAQ